MTATNYPAEAFRPFASVADICDYLDWFNYHRAAARVRHLVECGAASEYDAVYFAQRVAPDWVDGDVFADAFASFCGAGRES